MSPKPVEWLVAVDRIGTPTFGPSALGDELRFALQEVLARDAAARIAAWSEYRPLQAIPASLSDTLGRTEDGAPILRTDLIEAESRAMAEMESLIDMDVAFRLDSLRLDRAFVSIREWKRRVVRSADDRVGRYVDVTWVQASYARQGLSWILAEWAITETRCWPYGDRHAERSNLPIEWPGYWYRQGFPPIPRDPEGSASEELAGPEDIVTWQSIPEVVSPGIRIGPLAVGCRKEMTHGEFVYYETEPVPTKTVHASPPASGGAGGKVILHVYVCRDGRVGWVTVKSGPRRLTGAAVAAAAQWEFTPAKSNNKPVAVWVEVPIVVR